jgi:Flp pilus assembly protein TadD
MALLLFPLAVAGLGQRASAASAELVEKERIVEAGPPSDNTWAEAQIGETLPVHERLRTGSLSRAAVKLTDLSVLRLDELTTIEIQPPQTTSDRPVLDIKAGLIYMFSREKPSDLQIRTPVVTGALRGTEFAVQVGANGRTTLTMLDGEVQVSNALGSVVVHSGEQANIEPGQAPTKTAVIEATNIIQWCLYYPGVIDVAALKFTPQQRAALSASLDAYNAGDLLGALNAYPAERLPASPDEGVYRAALFLSVGQVGKARAELSHARGGEGIQAVEQMIASVKFETYTRKTQPKTAADWMAESYYQQSRSNLNGALKAALSATQSAPGFGFAWTRVAELEFGFGRIRPALRALETGLKLSPENAQAVALEGYLLAAENNTGEAWDAFDRAISLDGALGNAWLGRGLCEIRQNKVASGRDDIQVAATLEPNRSLLRSYMGKAFSASGRSTKALSEFTRAKQLDPHDPTPWLYSALENKMDNRINQAVADLETSLQLNDNRSVYRSQFMLDQDRAVRNANLAAIYQAAGMDEIAVRQATTAVTDDYSSASAHLFLADSYNNLRDPIEPIDNADRYTTPWYNELLLSFLLSPVGGGPLSQYVSEQEYSKLFESDRAGLSTSTNYFSTGIINEIASQYGTFGNFSYSLDTQYLDSRGDHPNGNFSLSESSGQFKLQLGPSDTLFVRAEFKDNRGGDNGNLYDQTMYIPDLHTTETESPGIVLLGYHHDWAPGIQTLLLLGRLADHLSYSQTRDVGISIPPSIFDPLQQLFVAPFLQEYRRDLLVYSAELQQTVESEGNTLVAGLRYQSGSFDTFSEASTSITLLAPFFAPTSGEFKADFERATCYLYDTIKPTDWLSLTGGVTYDYLLYPRNYLNIAASDGSTTTYRLSPKAGFTITPSPDTILQGAYARSLGGVSIIEDVQLEPTEIDGFPQVFRTVIPESTVGPVAAPRYETEGIGLRQKIASTTYLDMDFSNIYQQSQRQIGLFATPNGPLLIGQPAFFLNSTREKLSYGERTMLVTLNQLISREWSLGVRERLSYSELRDTFDEIPSSDIPREKQEGLFNQLQLYATYNHPSGWFARGEAIWFDQHNYGYQPALHGDDFWQLNSFVGYRFRNDVGEVSLGVLNILGQDYSINPLNSYYTPIDFYDNIPRKVTLLARVRLNF